MDKATNGKVKVNDNGVTVNDGNGNSASFGASTALPKDFPTSDVPLPKGKVTGAISTTDNGKGAWTVTIEPSGSVSDALSSYRSALESAGYTIQGSFNAGSGDSSVSTLSAVGTKYDVNVGGTTGNSTNGIVVTVTPHDPSNDTTTSAGSSN